ncbi:MAG TPA: LytTR family DNA-binding domain-containing protein [Bacteroidales bacterium]|nr:LytTR family DNA-binding domain-containing protein [Bacteroidales bacterium]HPS62708.1 LytTR family DNA-binding domain-containing protein [Bacteroidales bacterium]
MMTAIAIDDEPLALEVIRKYVADTPLVTLAATFTDAVQALAFLKARPVDLLILDIQMPDISGIQFLQKLSRPPMVIFTTAYAEYAVKGFELEAVDYLVKPIRFERFVKALEKANRLLKMQTAGTPAEEEGHVLVKSGYGTTRVNFGDILYIEGLDDYIRIHFTGDRKPVLSLMSLKSILEQLPHDRFIRVHRSFIVAHRHILSVRKKVIYLSKTQIPIGDTYAEELNAWMKRGGTLG